MDANLIDRIETATERGAAALFGGAIFYAAHEWLSGPASEPQRAAYSAAAAVAAFVLCSLALKSRARSQSKFRVPVFDLREFDEFATGELLLTDELDGELLLLTERAELVLTDADRLERDGVLLLDRVRAEIESGSRVVRLFDRDAMPSPGELKSRVDGHLEQGSAATGPVDASQALSDALAELKRSLR